MGALISGVDYVQAVRRRRELCAELKAAIAKKKQALIKGTFYEFAGPLYDQSGKLRVKKGKRMTVKELYAMNWLVRGTIGSAKG